MSIKISIIYPHFKALVNNQDIVEVNGNNIRECLEDLIAKFPAFRPIIFDDHGNLLYYINILHNNQSTHLDHDPLMKHVEDGDVIVITLLIAGG